MPQLMNQRPNRLDRRPEPNRRRLCTERPPHWPRPSAASVVSAAALSAAAVDSLPPSPSSVPPVPPSFSCLLIFPLFSPGARTRRVSPSRLQSNPITLETPSHLSLTLSLSLSLSPFPAAAVALDDGAGECGCPAKSKKVDGEGEGKVRRSPVSDERALEREFRLRMRNQKEIS